MSGAAATAAASTTTTGCQQQGQTGPGQMQQGVGVHASGIDNDYGVCHSGSPYGAVRIGWFTVAPEACCCHRAFTMNGHIVTVQEQVGFASRLRGG